jgi:hypothetical protein
VWRFFEAGEANPCQLLEPACNFAVMFWCIWNYLISNNYYLVVPEDTLPNHTNKTRSNRPVLVLKQHGNFRIHKRIGRNLPAFLPLFDARMKGRL